MRKVRLFRRDRLFFVLCLALGLPAVAGAQGTPSAPDIIDINHGDRQLSVEFTPPESDGGSPVLNYEYSTNNGATWTPRNPAATSSPLIISNLSNGTTYTVRLRAVNKLGPGTASAPVPATPSTTPSAPLITSITPGNGQLTVNFNAGLNGGAAITSYQYSTNDGTTWNPVNPPDDVVSPIVITGLSDATTYQVRLRAVNLNGPGNASNSVSATTLGETVPSAPTITAITAGDSQLSVAFTAGADGGSPITNYEYSTNGGTTWTARSPAATTSPLVITGLNNGTTYQVQLRAVNAVGAGAGSATVPGTPSTTPSAPTITVITPGNGQLSVAFTAGANGGAAITNYEYSINGGTTWTARSPAAVTSPLVVTGLTNGTTYQVQLRAVNVNGAGTASASVPGIPAAAPGAPTITAITPGNGQLSVAFTAGATGGSAITNYEYSTNGGSTWTPRSPAATTTPLIITGLSNGTTYQVQLRAVNALGVGTPSLSVAGTPSTTPSAPTITLITPGNGQLTVVFTAGATGGAVITNYEYSTNGGTTWTPRSPAAATSPLTITGLTNGTTYQVRLRAVNTNGAGAASAAVPGTPIPAGTVPAAPAISTIAHGNAQLTVAFVAGADGGSSITNYEYSIDNGTTWTARSPAATTTSLNILGLTNGTVYQVRLRALNAIGVGAASAPVAATPSTTPDAPMVTGVKPGNAQVSVVLVPGPDGGSAITNYKYSIDGGITWTARSPAATTSPVVLTGLTNGTTYQVRLLAVNGNGDGSATAPVPATPATTSDEAIDGFDPGANGDVLTMAVQPDGKILVGGGFTTLGGGGTGTLPRNKLGRLNPDGSVDATFDAGTNIASDSQVTNVAVQSDGQILVSSAADNPTGRRHIGRLNPDGSRDLTFDLAAANDRVLAVALQPDGKVLVGGVFTTLGRLGEERTRYRIGRFHADGTVDTSFDPGANGDVSAIAVQPDGRILVGGAFTMIGGSGTGSVPRNHLARLNTDGSVDMSFNPGVAGDSPVVVRALRLQPDLKILVGGQFTGLGGGTGTTQRHNIGRLNADGSVDTSFVPALAAAESPIVEGILPLPNGQILVGGLAVAMASGDLQPRHLARLNADGSLDADFEPGANGRVSTLTAQADGKILVGGSFTMMGDHVRNRIARLGSPIVLPAAIPPAPFSEPIVAGVTMLRALHILELRDRIDALRVRFGLPVMTWTDPALTGVPVSVVHVQQLRDALLLAYDAAFVQGRSVIRPVFADGTLTSRMSTIRALHIQQLRDAVVALEGP